MRRLLVSMLISSLAAVAAANRSDSVPPVAVPSEISLRANPGWFLQTAPNGSGAIAYGSTDFDKFPPGTFDFQAVYYSLEPIVQSDGTMRDFFTVAFHEREATTTYAQYTKHGEIVLPLFAKAKEHCLFKSKRLQEFWMQYAKARAMTSHDVLARRSLALPIRCDETLISAR